MKYLLLLLFVAADLAYGQQYSGSLVKLKDIVMEWIGIGAAIGVGLSGGVIVLGNLIKVKAFEYYANEYQKGLITFFILSALSLFFREEIASVMSSAGNIFGVQ